MAPKRMDNVGIVVDDLEATIDSFRDLGLERFFFSHVATLASAASSNVAALPGQE